MYLSLIKHFLYIGSVSFGGYMSMVAVIRRVIVQESKLLSEEKFSEGLALASLLPGPVAVNLSVYSGFLIAGRTGAVISLVSVLLPAFFLMTLLSQAFVFSGIFKYTDAVLFYVSGVAFAVILSAGILSIKKYCTNSVSVGVFLVSIVFLLLVPGYLSIIILFIVWAVAGQFIKGSSANSYASIVSSLDGRPGDLAVPAAMVVLVVFLGSWFFPAQVFREFTKISMALFGGGYVVVPLLNASLVEELKWISQSDLLTGISLGQLTPGPILISSVFYGQKIAGFSGSVAATAGMFLPPALLMIFCAYYLNYLRSSVFFNKALNLVFPFISGMIVAAAVQILLNTWREQPIHWHFTGWVLAFLCIHFLKINTILMMGLAIGAGLLTLVL
jgi:chromate transporter